MSKIICPCGECVHNGKNYICKADKVEFKWRNMATINEGRVDMWVCKQYELPDKKREVNLIITEITKHTSFFDFEESEE